MLIVLCPSSPSQDRLRKWGLEEKIMPIPKRGPSALLHPESLMAIRDLNPDDLMMGLKAVFEKYNLWEHGTNKGNMDKIRFAKCLRDAGLIKEGDKTALCSAAVDHIFFKVLPPASDR